MEFFLCVVGMMLVIEGLPLFGFPDKVKLVMEFVQEMDDAILRIMGGILMLIGLMILFLAREGLTFL